MIADLLRRLRFAAIESYQYVGLGSVYFTDFIQFHKTLGIKKMISIEAEKEDASRFEANKPYSTIEILFGKTGTELHKVDLSLRSVVWLDYDGTLSVEMFDDIRHVVSSAVSGSVLIVTVSANPWQTSPTDPNARINRLKRKFDPKRVPHSLTDQELDKWGTAEVFRKMINGEIRTVLNERNAGLPEQQIYAYQQLLNIQYQDSSKMLTVGGILFDEGQRGLFEQCEFGRLPFYTPSEDPFQVLIPRLTLKEIRSLEEQMPLAEGEAPELGEIPDTEAQKYISIYRYFPNFAPVDL